MVGQRKMLRLRPCVGCGHLRGSHYISAVGGSRQRHATARPGGLGPMPCHAYACACLGYADAPLGLPCPVCARTYLTRSSLEVHLAKTHVSLARRERSMLLDVTLRAVVLAP